jgi:hypothetical protein
MSSTIQFPSPELCSVHIKKRIKLSIEGKKQNGLIYPKMYRNERLKTIFSLTKRKKTRFCAIMNYQKRLKMLLIVINKNVALTK